MTNIFKSDCFELSVEGVHVIELVWRGDVVFIEIVTIERFQRSKTHFIWHMSSSFNNDFGNLDSVTNAVAIS